MRGHWFDLHTSQRFCLSDQTLQKFSLWLPRSETIGLLVIIHFYSPSSSRVWVLNLSISTSCSGTWLRWPSSPSSSLLTSANTYPVSSHSQEKTRLSYSKVLYTKLSYLSVWVYIYKWQQVRNKIRIQSSIYNRFLCHFLWNYGMQWLSRLNSVGRLHKPNVT